MPLISLKTDFKSLKYGKDTLGGGYSGQPYIQAKIPVGFNSLGPREDFILRGGISAITDSGTDVLRLTKMFGDLKSPNGLLFIAKQQLLSRNAVRTQASLGQLNEGPYLPSNTLAQAGVSAFGLHFMKQGTNPIQGAPGSLVAYSTVVKPSQPTVTNRLVTFYREKQNIKIEGNPVLYAYTGGPGSILGVGNTTIFLSPERTGVNNQNYQSYTASIQKSVLDDIQQGGLKIDLEKPWTKSPLYGLPITNANTPQSSSFDVLKFTGSLKPADATGPDGYFYNPVTSHGASDQYKKAFPGSLVFPPTRWNLGTGQKLWNNSVYNSGSTFPDSTNPANFDNGTITYSQKDLAAAESYRKTGAVPDFRAILRDKLAIENKKLAQTAEESGQLTKAPNYKDKRIEKRVVLGDPGDRKNKSYSSYTTGPVDKATGKPTGPLDLINASNIGEGLNLNDLVTFKIEAIGGSGLVFRAFLGSINDSFSTSLNTYKFVGRGENFYTYDGFSRKVSLSWVIAAQSKPELIPMYKRLSYLASNTTPIYRDGFMQGPLVELSVGGYFNKMPGYIESLSIEMAEDVPWEIAIDVDGNIDKTVTELPHVIKVSGFSFVPIPRYLPQRGAHYIDLENNGVNLWGK